MGEPLLYVIAALGISIVLNILLKKIGISQIIGYILTGIIIVYAFDLSSAKDSHTLELVGEFGIVFLMFTIGLEISLSKMGSMKKEIFGNGFMQVAFTAIVVYAICVYIFGLDFHSAAIISLGFSLSSTAVVLSYLKSSKEIYSPYGQKSTGILIFQDIAVIPILIFIGFLTSGASEGVFEVLKNTLLSAVFVVGLLFVVGKKLMTWLLHFSASSELEELFMGSVLLIVICASLLAHYMGFSYSLGAFVAGMIIAETRYHHKVESDILPFKDILLGTFFVTVGMKVDMLLFLSNLHIIIGLFVFIFIIKTIIIYGVLRVTSQHVDSLKSALALSQVGEFSFVIFAVASMGGIIAEELVSLLVLVVIFSMVVTPFFIAKIGRIVEFFGSKEQIADDLSSLEGIKDHVIVCGYSVVGKFVVQHLDMVGAKYIVVDNSPKHVQEAKADGLEAYLGDASKSSILNALRAVNAASVIVTLDNLEKKRLICEGVLKYNKHINLVVKVVSLEEKQKLSDLDITFVVDGKLEVARVLVERMLSCQLKYK